ncbi:MAG: hypothetical protein AB2A00_38560 [Myxococcota bacterium]
MTTCIEVKGGESIFELLRGRGVPEPRLRIAAAEVQRLNRLDDIHNIPAGMRLRVPESFVYAAPRAAPVPLRTRR